MKIINGCWSWWLMLAACSLLILVAYISGDGGDTGKISEPEVNLIPVAPGFADTSVNAVIFRKHSLFTHNGSQYISFYDAKGFVVIGKRQSGSSDWKLHQTEFTGDVEDAHNSISLAVDGNGFIHLAWNHHNDPLNYAVSLDAGSLEMSEKYRPGSLDTDHSVTYPEFYRMPDGDLIFMYRNGWSGDGSQVVHRYDLENSRWKLLHEQLIDGGGQVNPYWQTAMDKNGTFHLSWNWRRHGGVETNHNMMYARSHDGGVTWERSTGEPYELPITAETAEIAAIIAENSSLMNQTSMAADSEGRPYIVSYWAPEGSDTPQYHMIFFYGEGDWRTVQIGSRSGAFELKGEGTMAPPISRPQIIAQTGQGQDRIVILFRDEERGKRVSAAVTDDVVADVVNWQFVDLTEEGVGAWEPTLDHQLWQEQGVLNLFVQRVGQGNHEQAEEIGPQMIYVLEWNPERRE